MISKFCVVRYLPNPLSGEIVNVGVIAWSEGRIATQFVKNWKRVKAFGREDISFLRDFAEQAESSSLLKRNLPTLGPAPLTEKQLQEIAETWSNSIQFSELRTSLKAPEEVVREVSAIYLPELPHLIHAGRPRRNAGLLALHAVSEALRRSRGPEAGELVKKQYNIKGKVDEHSFDVVVSNGRPYFAAQGLSLERTFSRAVQKDIDATAWAIDDIRKASENFPLAVLALASDYHSEPIERARKIFGSLRADMVSEEQFSGWTTRAIRRLPNLPALGASRRAKKAS